MVLGTGPKARGPVSGDLNGELRHLPDVVFTPGQAHAAHPERADEIDLVDHVVAGGAVVDAGKYLTR